MEQIEQKDVMAQYIYWLWNEIIVDLLKSIFYVTECYYQNGGSIAYYPSNIWNKIVKYHIANNDMFVKLKKAQVWEITQHPEAHAIGNLRFVPKKNSLRPIISLCRQDILQRKNIATNEIVTRKLDAANHKLREAFAILNYEVENYDQQHRGSKCLGFTTLSVKEYYNKWKDFALKVKQHYPHLQTRPKVYCVVLDFAKCYDRINQDVMLELLNRHILRSVIICTFLIS
ncbi:hypothetical protein RFI_30861 [Reticulomyxa filosa]|uniref:Telomerase reverse transcriptase n=1 Tax=Reticulomyxa filosa TaxID=46433 RepID=X6LY40_RETFI|nr:hypothetical protein RFI_30861 [Reticulomyxa filosa]|eukprot:ETO06529.1 hypothetical protein RFI_30861 [Reticulomyxa filosa]